MKPCRHGKAWCAECGRWPVIAALVAAALIAAACTFGPAKYDPIETVSYIEVWQWSERLRETCGSAPGEARAIMGLQLTMERLSLVTKYGPDDDSRAIFAEVKKVVDEVRAGGSRFFCEEASTNIQAAAERALRAVGRRPR